MRIHAHTHINIACTIQSAVHIRGHLNQPYLLLLLWYRHYAFTLLKFFFFRFHYSSVCSCLWFSVAVQQFFFLPAAYVRVHIHSTSFFHLHFYIIWVSYSYLFHSQFLTSCSSICIETLALILSQHNNLAMSLLLCSPNIRVAFPHICFNVPRWLLISASFSFP